MTAEQIAAELHKTEAALAASHEAMKTHGHQGITWAYLRADSQRVAKLREQLARATATPKETIDD